MTYGYCNTCLMTLPAVVATARERLSWQTTRNNATVLSLVLFSLPVFFFMARGGCGENLDDQIRNVWWWRRTVFGADLVLEVR